MVEPPIRSQRRLFITRNRLVIRLLVVKDLTEVADVHALAADGALVEMLKLTFRLFTDSGSLIPLARFEFWLASPRGAY